MAKLTVGTYDDMGPVVKALLENDKTLTMKKGKQIVSSLGGDVYSKDVYLIEYDDTGEMGESRAGKPKSDEERKKDHKKKFGTDKLPPRGTGKGE